MTTVVISAYNVANNPEIGGHFWVYMQYAPGLRRLGCDVVWLEAYRPHDRHTPSSAVSTFFRRMERHGLGGRAILYEVAGSKGDAPVRFTGMSTADAEAALSGADLLLNFHYAIAPGLLS